MIEAIANQLGLPVAGFGFIFALFLSFPLAACYRLLESQNRSVRLLYCLLAGLSTLYMQWGSETLWIVFSVAITYLILKVFGNSQTGLQISWIFNFGFLLTSYYFYETENYDINWTTPQCVMCLRLIALSFDYFDSSKKDLPADQKANNYKELPSLLEWFGFCFYFPTVHCGPLIQWNDFKDFIDNTKCKDGRPKPTIHQSLRPSLIAAAKGVGYLVSNQLLEANFPQSYYEESGFATDPFWYQSVFVVMRGYATLFKYFACWKLTEGACHLTNVSFMGYKENNEINWGMRNIQSWKCLTSLTLRDVPNYFNVNTNKWAMQYIYKRLRFLGDKKLSQLGTLMFLAVWHGFHISYPIVFFLEFLAMYGESQYIRVFKPIIDYCANPSSPKPIVYMLKSLALVIRTYQLNSAAMIFEVLNTQRLYKANEAMGFYNHTLWIVGCLLTFSPALPCPKNPVSQNSIYLFIFLFCSALFYINQQSESIGQYNRVILLAGCLIAFVPQFQKKTNVNTNADANTPASERALSPQKKSD